MLFAGLSGAYCLIYLDDIIVFTTTSEEHLQQLVLVFDKLRAAGLKLKPKEYHFSQADHLPWSCDISQRS